MKSFYSSLIISFFCVFSMVGCETLKGLTAGIKKDFQKSSDSINNVPQIVNEVTNKVDYTDTWIKNNWW